MQAFEVKNIIKSKYKVLKETNKEILILINGHRLRYLKDSHKYIVDGYETASVTDIVKRTNPDLYKDVDKKYLNIGSRRGNALHDSIYYYESTGNKGFSDEFKSYLELKEEYNIKSLENELFVLICNTKNEPLCAGRLDMLYIKNDLLGILEFKRTYELYLDNVSLQLNLYRYGFTQTYGIDISELLCFRLRDSLKEVTNIKIDSMLAESALYAYL